MFLYREVCIDQDCIGLLIRKKRVKKNSSLKMEEKFDQCEVLNQTQD